jgi:hypothetical protein
MEHIDLREFCATHIAFERDVIDFVSSRAMSLKVLFEIGLSNALTTLMAINLLTVFVTFLVLEIAALGVKALITTYHQAVTGRRQMAIDALLLHLCIAHPQ